jgi:hypothetical protein
MGMAPIWGEALEVLATAQERRRVFLETELKLSRTALDLARIELQAGDRHFAAQEILAVEKAC